MARRSRNRYREMEGMMTKIILADLVGHVKILQYGSGSNDAVMKIFHSDTFEVFGFEMLQ